MDGVAGIVVLFGREVAVQRERTDMSDERHRQKRQDGDRQQMSRSRRPRHDRQPTTPPISCPTFSLALLLHAPWPTMMGSGMSGMMLLMFIGWLVVVGAVATGIWWLLRHRPRAGNAALDVLRERYARGEITREEFESKRRDLAA